MREGEKWKGKPCKGEKASLRMDGKERSRMRRQDGGVYVGEGLRMKGCGGGSKRPGVGRGRRGKKQRRGKSKSKSGVAR